MEKVKIENVERLGLMRKRRDHVEGRGRSGTWDTVWDFSPKILLIFFGVKLYLVFLTNFHPIFFPNFFSLQFYSN